MAVKDNTKYGIRIREFIKKGIEVDDSILKKVKKAMEVASDVYYHSGSEPLVTDEEFDKCVKKYEKYTGEKFYGSTLKNSSKKLVDTEHRFPDLVGTLDKVNSVEEFYNEWLIPKITKTYKLIKSNIPLIITGKEDGNSVVGTFNKNGKSIQWLTRGKDGVGLDLTSLFESITIPVKEISGLNDIGEFGIKFEAVMTDERLEQYSEKSGRSFANSRSAVAGILSAKDGHKWVKYIQLVPLRIQTLNEEKQMSRTKEFEIINMLCQIKKKLFLYPSYDLLVIGYSKGEYIVESGRGISTNKRVPVLDFLKRIYKEADLERNMVGSRPKDGLVIEFAKDKDRRLLGREKDRNRFDVALKFPYQIKETTVKNIEFYVGKSGRITPVVIFSPLIFNGATCDHVSIANYKRFTELKLFKGCKVNIEYRNDVLCYLTREDYSQTGKIIPFIKKCPICDSNVVLNEKETFAYCENENCPGRAVGKITNWLLKLGIKGINEKTIETLVKEHLIQDIDDLYKLTPKSFEDVPGFGEKSSTKIVELINSRKEIYDYELFGSLNIEGFSLSTAKDVCRKINWDKILEIYKEDPKKLKKELIKVKNVSDKTAEIFLEGLKQNYKLIKRLIKRLSIRPSLKLKDGKEFNIVFSGFRDKALERLIEEKGYCYKTSVSSKTNLLVVLDINQETTKATKAYELGVKVIDYKTFIREYIEEAK